METEDAAALAALLNTNLSITSWLQLVAFGGFLGIGGQAIRTLAGLKKAGDVAGDQGKRLADTFDTGRFFRSLLIGAVAGFLAAFVSVEDLNAISREVVLGIMAAGYAGTDFIEAFVQRHFSPPVVAAAITAPETIVTTTTAVNSPSGQAVEGDGSVG